MQLKSRILLFLFFAASAVVAIFYPAPGIAMMQAEREQAERRAAARRRASRGV